MSGEDGPAAKRVKIEGLQRQLHFEPASNEPSQPPNEQSTSQDGYNFSAQEMIAELERRDQLFMCGCGVSYYYADPSSSGRTLSYLHKPCHSGSDWRNCAHCQQRFNGREDFMSHMFGKHKKVN